MEFKDLVGKVLVSIENKNRELILTTNDGQQYEQYHSQDCCEGVEVEDICGDVSDVLNSPILVAEEVTSNKNPPDVKKEYQDSFTWTFYKLETAKGGITIRWYGESNGYYSEEVSFRCIQDANN